MKTFKASEFKAKCLQLMDDVAETGESIIITKNGRPIAQLVSYKRKPKSLFGTIIGAITIKGDIVSPIDVDWDALR